MGQQEVYDFLKKNQSKWYTSKDISKSINISLGSVTMSLKKLRNSNFVMHKKHGKRNQYLYSFKK